MNFFLSACFNVSLPLSTYAVLILSLLLICSYVQLVLKISFKLINAFKTQIYSFLDNIKFNGEFLAIIKENLVTDIALH